MTIHELKQLSDSIESDRAFLAHPEIRRAWWKAMGTTRFAHSWRRIQTGTDGWIWHCAKCGIHRVDQTSTVFECEQPDPIPGSLPDAVECLRQKVAERVKIPPELTDVELERRYIGAQQVLGIDYALELRPPRDRFLIFLAALSSETNP